MLNHLSPFRGHDKRAPPYLEGTYLSGPRSQRDALVASAKVSLIIHPASAGTTSALRRRFLSESAPQIFVTIMANTEKGG